MKTKNTYKYILRFLGNFCIFFAIILTFRMVFPILKEEGIYFLRRKKNVNSIVSIGPITKTTKSFQSSQLLGLLNRSQDEYIVPVDLDFSIVIPKIAANAKVIRNVNPADPKEYLSTLSQGVAHAAGTYLPGQGRNIFMFAHSTDNIWNVGQYNAVFYLLYKLVKGDEIDVFLNGIRHKYTVSELKIVNPDDVEYLVKRQEKEVLILQTCWPPGTLFKRLLVIATKDTDK